MAVEALTYVAVRLLAASKSVNASLGTAAVASFAIFLRTASSRTIANGLAIVLSAIAS